MLLSIGLCFLFALLVPFLGGAIKSGLGKWLALLPLGIFVRLWLLGTGTQVEALPWFPELGIGFDMRSDGLSRLFGLLISGMGTLVFFYSDEYLHGHPKIDRFYGFLSLFMGAMLGLVFSENLIGLFVFWELTSISSFFLIGFNHDSAASRQSALTALLVTGLGGLSLLGGAVLLGVAGGSFSMQALEASVLPFSEQLLYLPVVLLFFGAAFTKSAQFPFHFWLPGAMKAPTPVSTYLHSATMVKAGVYLLLRFSPLLGGTMLWQQSLLWVGGLTMLYAAGHSIFRTDMKAILAYSTIAALGLLVFLIGMGTPMALQAAGVFILVHAMYKASLFLVTGVVDHAVHSREVLQLSGLRKVMLPVALAGGLAALSNAGIPPSFGFVGKELMYESAWQWGNAAVGWMALLAITNLLLLYAGFLVGVKPFLGPLPAHWAELKPTPLRLYLPPLLLAGCSLLFGLLPALPEVLIMPFSAAVSGESGVHLALWHGFTPVLGWSVATIVSGLLLWRWLKPAAGPLRFLQKWERLSPSHLLASLGKAMGIFAVVWTNAFQHGYLRYYVMTIVLVLMGGMGYGLLRQGGISASFQPVLELTIYEVAILGIMLVSIFFAVFSRSRLAAVAGLGVVGYAICLLFVFYSAPDLAMTQFTVDTLTVILFVLVLYRLPRYRRMSTGLTIARDAGVALVFGALVTLLALVVLDQPVQRDIADFYAANAYLLAKGKNVVNVILVDFRGLDTLVEITVLSIAAIGVFGLLKLRLKSAERRSKV